MFIFCSHHSCLFLDSKLKPAPPIHLTVITAKAVIQCSSAMLTAAKDWTRIAQRINSVTDPSSGPLLVRDDEK